MFGKTNPEKAGSFGLIVRHLDESCRTKNFRTIKIIHGHLLRKGLLTASPILHTHVILSYLTCIRSNKLGTLRNLFKFLCPQEALPFNWIISCLCRNGLHSDAVGALSCMHKNGVPMDSYALCVALKATNEVRDINFGKQIHSHLTKSGWLSSVFVGSALVDLYSKMDTIRDAAMLFDEIPVKNTVCANALISGYCDAKLWNDGLDVAMRMPLMSLDYDAFTLSAILRACAGLPAIALGRQVHGHLLRNGHDLLKDVFLLSCLIEMYGKYGLVDKAWYLFSFAGFRRLQKTRDIVLWTSMLGVYGKNGHYESVIKLFEEMLLEGLRPDHVSFVTVISACARAGLVQLGIKYFESMINVYKLEPRPEHYGCLVDLLCRAGELDSAVKFIENTVCKRKENDSISMWGALLSACEDSGHVELGRLAARKALELEPHNAGIYILLSNLYAKLGMWEDIKELRRMVREKGLPKDNGKSWIEVLSYEH